MIQNTRTNSCWHHRHMHTVICICECCSRAMSGRTLWSTEVSEGWQREDRVGDEVDGVQRAADVVRLTGLNTTSAD